MEFEEAILQEQSLFGDLARVGRRLITGVPLMRKMKGKKVVVLVGPTGSGKSCIANSVISGVDAMGENSEDEIVTQDAH